MKQNLIAAIDSMRVRMVAIAQTKGLDDPIVLQISQEIDCMLNELNGLNEEGVNDVGQSKYSAHSERSTACFNKKDTIRDLSADYFVQSLRSNFYAASYI